MCTVAVVAYFWLASFRIFQQATESLLSLWLWLTHSGHRRREERCWLKGKALVGHWLTGKVRYLNEEVTVQRTGEASDCRTVKVHRAGLMAFFKKHLR